MEINCVLSGRGRSVALALRQFDIFHSINAHISWKWKSDVARARTAYSHSDLMQHVRGARSPGQLKSLIYAIIARNHHLCKFSFHFLYCLCRRRCCIIHSRSRRWEKKEKKTKRAEEKKECRWLSQFHMCNARSCDLPAQPHIATNIRFLLGDNRCECCMYLLWLRDWCGCLQFRRSVRRL